MTANSTLPATQCASVVAVPQRCQQLRRNLVTTKTYKPTIMAAGALVSKPSQLHANLVPKRNKMVVCAYPETKTVEISTNGFPEFIECRINNESGKELILDWSETFLGSGKFDGIEGKVTKTSSFKQQAASWKGSDRYASGYVIYNIEENLRWIIVWRNAMDERNKVYTAIISGAKEGSTETLVRESTEKSSFHDNSIKYAAEAEIDPTSSRPIVTAKLTVKSTPESDEPTPESDGPTPESDEPTPESDEPTPESNE